MKELPENWTDNTEANEDSEFLTQEERDSAVQEQSLSECVDKLCAELTELKVRRWSHCAEDGAYYTAKPGRKYIKIVSYDNSNGSGGSVWGFINKSNEKFEVGDVLLAAGWATPALNKSRGNLFEGYPVLDMGDRFMYGPGYCSGAIAGTPRDGGFV